MGKKVVIMGAAGRDFHNFNMCYRDNPEYEVVAFTAAQIPFIENRTYPPELSGRLYPEGIPVYPESMLGELIREKDVDEAVFSYSDVSHEYVMHRASFATALGANFVLLGSEKTMLRSKRPVVSVTAVRTGSGKSGVTRNIALCVKEAGKRPVVVRHPMPYGELKRAPKRFQLLSDLKGPGLTIEELEEFEPLVEAGVEVWSGVDYGVVLEEAEKKAQVIIWDGGNNDLPFIRPDLECVVVDPLRPGHEVRYYPGEANLMRADWVIINKANSARPEDIEMVRKNIREKNPGAGVLMTGSFITVEGSIEGKSVLVIEDGPTLTHGGMSFGAGIAAAKMFNAKPVDPRPYATGTIKETLLDFPHLKNLVPAMGYAPFQIAELEETINSTPCDCVLIATPVNLSNVIKIKKPSVRVRYEVRDIESPGIKGVVEEFVKGVE